MTVYFEINYSLLKEKNWRKHDWDEKSLHVYYINWINYLISEIDAIKRKLKKSKIELNFIERERSKSKYII